MDAQAGTVVELLVIAKQPLRNPKQGPLESARCRRQEKAEQADRGRGAHAT